MAASLHAVPERGPYRDGVYIRVSAVMGREDERFVSPELQRAAIARARAAAPGPATLVWEGQDIDESGRTFKRDAITEALALAQQGKLDRLWVMNLSRWARATAEGLAELQAIEAAGCKVFSTAEQVDLNTPTGYFSATLMLAVAKLQSDQIGDSWRKVHAYRVSQGKTPTGKPKWGYIWDREASIHKPDPHTGEALTRCYERYVAGESMYALVGWLNSTGYRTSEGYSKTGSGQWTARSLRRVMDSGFAAGFILYQGVMHEGAHDALIDQGLWQRYLDARVDRRAQPRRTERSQYVFSTLVVHAPCGGRMVAGQYGHGRQPKYRCKRGAESSGTICTGGYVMASTIEADVLAWLHELADEVDTATAAKLAQDARRTVAATEREGLQREIDRLDQALVKLTVRLNDEVISEQMYRGARAEYESKRVGLQEALDALGREERRSRDDAPELARELLAVWTLHPVPQRREALRKLIARIEVTTGRPRSTTHIVPVWDVEQPDQ